MKTTRRLAFLKTVGVGASVLALPVVSRIAPKAAKGPVKIPASVRGMSAGLQARLEELSRFMRSVPWTL